MITLFNLPRKQQTFLSWLHHLALPPVTDEGPIPPHPCILLFSSLLLLWVMAAPVRMNRYLCGFNCISLMTIGVEHLSMCLIAVCISCLKKSLFESSAHFIF